MRVTGTIGHLAYSETAEIDRYGNDVPGHLAAVDFPVYAVQPKQSVEPVEAGRRAIVSGATVFAPITNPRPGPHDRFLVDGETWEVVGKVGVWDGKRSPVGGFLVPGGYQFDIEERRG